MSNITLCRTWKNAVLNEHGVFSKNMLTFECAEEKRPGIGAKIHCAMEYPKVYVEFSLSASLSHTGALPDRDSMNFDVHDSASDVMRLTTNAIEEQAKGHNVPKNLIRGALDKMKNAITDVCIDSVDEEKALEELEKDCFPEECIMLLDNGNCVECDYKIKANEIKRSFEAEGWKEVPEAERENAISGNCWIDERNMDPMEPRKGTKFFIIDTKQLKWSFYFRTKIKKV